MKKSALACIFNGIFGLVTISSAIQAEAADDFVARNCEAFINRVSISSRGAAYAGSSSFCLDVKTIPERFDSPLKRIVGLIEDSGQLREVELESVGSARYQLTVQIGTYYPVSFRTLRVDLVAETENATRYHVASGTGSSFVLDQTAYENVRGQGSVWYDPYFNASSSTQEGRFGGYYNPQNCY